MVLNTINRDCWISGIYCQKGDYYYIDDKCRLIVHLNDIPRNYRGKHTPRLTAYKPVEHTNWHTHETCVIWECTTAYGRVARAIWVHFYKHHVKRPDPYNGIEECQKNAVVRKSKHHQQLYRRRDSFKGMVHLSYGEQCIAQTFESYRKSCAYNQETM